MSDNERNRRIDDASSLIDDIAALDRVKVEQRIGLVHDRLMSAIDDICEKSRNGGASAYNQKQIRVLKDIAFQIVYILDKRNQPPRGLVPATISYYKRTTAFNKIAILAGVVTIMAGLLAYGEKGIQLIGWISKDTQQTDNRPQGGSENPPQGQK